MKTASQGSSRFAIVDDFEPPEPRVQARVQPERDPMPDAALLSLPDIAVVRSADAKPRLGTDHGQNCRLRSARAQIEPRHAVGDWGSERLVDHDPAVRLRMLDGEDRSARQKADRKPRPVGDPQKAELVPARRCQDLNRRVRHAPLLPLRSASIDRPGGVCKWPQRSAALASEDHPRSGQQAPAWDERGPELRY